ncbi:GNAT family N-acetyltransferase [Micromonospora rifamycinica]|uniref:Ribosomal protein S18 acetylase RimI n=1 Tax=Micromonospora rifamycinica TaxID=291594 RepID=A0A109IGZ5_9ACTN|nr:GNAT family N-acetyltransferase [Micromonospora rifamycinica]KWV30283.1 acetyltransferase [Micromonospora rifamycinica]SCG81023.1 Ribosomal protein S18 acetylase RimI [Micromonospora rifamycinica]
MINVRRAVVADAGEIVRLRGVMLADMDQMAPAPGPWQQAAREVLHHRLAEPADLMAVFVVDDPRRPGALAACATGTIEQRLGGPDNPGGLIGYVFNVVTEPAYRRRGFSRACLEALLDWYRQRGVGRVDLRASVPGEPLYRSLGFVPTSGPTLRLSLPVPAGRG